MNTNLLKGYIVSNGYNTATFIKALNEKGTKMSRSTWYRCINGKQQFTIDEIRGMAKLLTLKGQEILSIFFSDVFFDEKVS